MKIWSEVDEKKINTQREKKEKKIPKRLGNVFFFFSFFKSFFQTLVRFCHGD